MKFSTLLAFVGALPLLTRSTYFPDRRMSLGAILLALHESRQCQANQQIKRYRHLIDRRDSAPKMQDASGREAGHR